MLYLDKRPHEGLDVNDLPTDEWKNQKPHQTNDKESDVNETGVIPQNFVVGLARKVSTEEEDVTHRGQQLSKRAVFSEEVQNRDQAEQNKQAAKKPRSDTESHLHKPHPKLKPNEPLILKSKETKLVTALEENLVSTEKESSFHKTNDTALTDLNYQSHHSKVTDETEGLYSPAKTDSAKSRQEGELVKVLLKFPNLFHEDDDGDT